MKKKYIAALLLAVNLLPAFASASTYWGSPGFGQCGGSLYSGDMYCEDGYTCVYVDNYYSQCLPLPGTTFSKTFSLVSPPGLVKYVYPGGQSIILTAKNLNFLGALVTVTCNYGRTWSLVSLPFAEDYKGYSILHPIPVYYSFQASTDADAALISFSCK
ncbi:hypothetical protein [Pedobacter sp. D749]|uniref:hypothetical protein n=1 Tax=Pedobacter sp. D749 TaxID=2856523 RepID=UPI001C5A1215|nr:hypothetical protein [Pedobacter sp. D749]QXU39895.1 hypothetical protein KYH19_12760 [Pedobacter sp. D749]